MTKDFNGENSKLINERNELRTKLDSVLDEYKSKTKLLEDDLKNLQELYEKTKISLNENLKLNNELTHSKAKLTSENSSLQNLTGEQKIRILDLEKELEQLRLLFETSSKDSQLELKIRMDKLSKELNAKWSEVLRIECDNLRNELQKLKEEEKRSELEKLESLKDEELRNLKTIWQAKTNELLDEVKRIHCS